MRISDWISDLFSSELGPINCPLGTTLASVYSTMRCLTDAGIPSNEGCKRPIQVIAPPGSLVNARSPAAVMPRMIVCHSIVDLIMGALAEAIPERVMGDCCGCLHHSCMAIHPRLGQRVMFGEVVPGGIGATPNGDGINVMACHVTNCHIPDRKSTRLNSSH